MNDLISFFELIKIWISENFPECEFGQAYPGCSVIWKGEQIMLVDKHFNQIIFSGKVAKSKYKRGPLSYVPAADPALFEVMREAIVESKTMVDHGEPL